MKIMQVCEFYDILKSSLTSHVQRELCLTIKKWLSTVTTKYAFALQ
jgi:hypothetical protein